MRIAFNMEKSKFNINYALNIQESLDIINNTSTLKIDIEYWTIEDSGNHDFNINVKVNDTTVLSVFKDIRIVGYGGGYKKLISCDPITLSHNDSGGGSYTVTAELNADYSGIGSLGSYKTRGSISTSVQFSEIDTTAPTLLLRSISADRYGQNALCSLYVEHSEYGVKSLELNITDFGTYKAENVSAGEKVIDINAVKPGIPLLSGKTYSYTISATAKENLKTATITGTFTVPQKVTGITVDSPVIVKPGGTFQLSWSVMPSTAELKAVSFSSDDSSIVSVTSSGVITGEAEGFGVITVTTEDGSFQAEITVEVTDVEAFQELEPIDILTAAITSKIQTNILILGDRLDISISSISPRRDLPILQIKSTLDTLVSNCLALKHGTEHDYPTEHLPEDIELKKKNTNWHSTINECIAFLNELNEVTS